MEWGSGALSQTDWAGRGRRGGALTRCTPLPWAGAGWRPPNNCKAARHGLSGGVGENVRSGGSESANQGMVKCQ